MDTRRPKSEREAKDNLEKDGGEGKKQGGVEELGSSQSSGTEQGMLVGKRDGLMRLLARQELMIDDVEAIPKEYLLELVGRLIYIVTA